MHASSRINNIIITCMIALLHCYCQLSAMASKARSTLSSRRRKRSEEATEPRQLLRPHPESYKGAFDLLNRTSLTKEDVAAYLRGEQSVGPAAINPNEQAYNNRRREIRELAAKVTSDEAEIDEHGRLVPTPRPDVPGAQNPVPQGEPVRPAPPVHPADHEEEERRWLEREDREAAEAIARAVRRLRQAGVPEEDFELIRIPRREQNAVNLTFRRICFAVLAVTTAFVVIMLQTMPLLRTIKQTDLEFDVVLYDLLQVRHVVTHIKHCNGLHRHESNATSLLEGLLAWARRNSTTINCADGVLHIPSRQVLLESSSMYQEEYDVLEPYAAGVNVSWFFPCRVPENLECISDCFPGSNSSSCSTEADPCFRGVHDGIILHREVNGALRLGHHLIQQGGDHIEIHRNTSLLSEWIPSIVTKLEDLLRSQYKLQGHWQPVAFRISVALPMDGTGVRLYGYVGDSLLEHTFNRTVYIDWLESTRRKNELAAYSLPPPFSTKSVRDVCYLMSDLEADPDFAVHTSVFLSDSAGAQYAGGTALYVDDHPSNAIPRNKIQRGVSIDGYRGRIVVSSGGAENRRCRLPTRAGIRAVLQIWWNCTGSP